MPKTAAVQSLIDRLPATHPAQSLIDRQSTSHAAPSLMDDRQFMAELETMEAVPKVPSPPAPLLERVRRMEDGFVAGQPQLHVHVSERSHTKRPRTIVPDRNTFQPAPLEPDEEYQHDDETSVTVSARVAAFAIMASGLAGVGAAALVFHARLAQILTSAAAAAPPVSSPASGSIPRWPDGNRPGPGRIPRARASRFPYPPCGAA